MELDETTELGPERTYSAYIDCEHLAFDPLKDLNLPSSYEEVVSRYAHLRGNRDLPSLS